MAKTRVAKEDVLASLQKHRHCKRREVAAELGCSEVTISNKVRELIKDGEDIGFDSKGLFYLDVDTIKKAGSRDTARKYLDRITKSLWMWAKRGNSHKKIALAVRKQFVKEFTKEELTQFKEGLLLVGRAVDVVLFDKEIE